MSEVDFLVSKVGEYMRVLETLVMPDRLEMKVETLSGDIHRDFDALRREIVPLDYIPVLRRNGGWRLLIVKIGRRKFRGPWLNLVLFIATVFSTWYVGIGLYESYFGIRQLTGHVAAGAFLYFSLPLLGILSVHEFSHYLAARHYGVRASLPFFIPAPTIVGTLGAFISMRDPIPNRRALIVIGAAGPIGGFIAAIPVAIVGSYLNSAMPAAAPTPTGPVMVIGLPLINSLLSRLIPISGIVHPTYYAAWVSFIVTAMNLLPLGQLDGGHISRGLVGEHARYVSWATFLLMMFLGILYFPGWIIFGILALIFGMRHPPPLDDYMPVGRRHVAIGVASILIFGLTFVPAPITVVTPQQTMVISAPPAAIASPGNVTSIAVTLANRGPTSINATPEVSLSGLQAQLSLFPRPPYRVDPGGEARFVIILKPERAGIGEVDISVQGASASTKIYSGILTDNFGIYFNGTDFVTIKAKEGVSTYYERGVFGGPPGNYVFIMIPDEGLNATASLSGVPIEGGSMIPLRQGDTFVFQLIPDLRAPTNHLDLTVALFLNGYLHASTISILLP